MFGSPVPPNLPCPSSPLSLSVTVTRPALAPTMHDAPLTNGVHLNGDHTAKPAPSDTADSPAIDSPATPVNDSPTPTVKIDVQYDDHLENNISRDPVDMKVEIEEDASTAQAETPAGAYTVDINPARATQTFALVDTGAVDKGSPPPSSQDVPMSEGPQDADVDMAEVDPPAPNHAATAASSSVPQESLATSSPYSTSSPNDDDIQPPPAKRARKHSDADQASLANVRLFCPVRRCGRADSNIFAVSLKTATPPPGSVSPAPVHGPPTLSVSQYRFCVSTVRTLKKMKAAAPFLLPVDPVALNIPHYPQVIKHPMDFSTVERKLQSSSPAKPDPNPSNPRYLHADEFVADVRLVFANALTFNGPEHIVTQLSKQVEEVFDKQMKNLPPPDAVRASYLLILYIIELSRLDQAARCEESCHPTTASSSASEEGCCTTAIQRCTRHSSCRGERPA